MHKVITSCMYFKERITFYVRKITFKIYIDKDYVVVAMLCCMLFRYIIEGTTHNKDAKLTFEFSSHFLDFSIKIVQR